MTKSSIKTFGHFIAIILILNSCNSDQSLKPQLSEDFSQKVKMHILELSKIDSRYIGSNSIKLAEDYIAKQFRQIGLKTTVENFEFESFEIENSNLVVGELTITPSKICFNPYKDSLNVTHKFILIDTLPAKGIPNSYVITTAKVDYFQIVFNTPKMIIYVDSIAFAKLSLQKERTFKLTIKGQNNKYQSANIIADLKQNSQNLPMIMLCAHYDSYLGSPGADDNASGTAELIELANVINHHKKSIDGYNIKFIAFTGEEKGLLGSRHFLDSHNNELKNTALVINLDQIGGMNPIYITVLDSIRGIPAIKGENQFPAYLKDKPFDGVTSKWTIIAPEIFKLMAISNTPNWLVKAIKKSSDGINVSYSSSSGSDELTFTQAGIVSTCIFTQGNQYHNFKDLTDQIKPETIVDVGNLVMRIIKYTINN